MAYIAYAAAWISTSTAVTAAIWITQSATPLWIMIIPALITVKSDKKNRNSDKTEE